MRFVVGVPIAVPRVWIQLTDIADFLRSVGVISVRAGCRQVIDVYGDLSRELLQAA